MTVSYVQGQRVSSLNIAVNGALSLIKLVTGVVGNSAALIADAVESIADIFSSATVWGGLTIASRPADEDHPYGHGKAEPLAALAVALLLIVAAAGIALHASHGIREPHPSPAGYTLVVLLIVVVTKETLFRVTARTARRIDSTAMTADAWHHRSDAVTSAIAAVGIGVALLAGPGYESADDWAALAASLVIAGNGIRFVKTAVEELMDTTPRNILANDIQRECLEVSGAQFVEKLLIRKVGPRLYLDLHLEVDPAMTVRDAHQIAHAVKDRIMAKWSQIADILVHLEPHSPTRRAQSGSSTHTTPSRTSAG